MHTNLWFWIAFNCGVLCVLAMDLFGHFSEGLIDSHLGVIEDSTDIGVELGTA